MSFLSRLSRPFSSAATAPIYLSYCSVAPLHLRGLAAVEEFSRAQAEFGINVFSRFPSVLEDFRRNFATLLKTEPGNIAYCSNVAEPLNHIANSYPFEPGDRILSYADEFPSNYFPWEAAVRNRGAALDLIPSTSDGTPAFENLPQKWNFADLERAIVPKTRIIALSHTQYTNGYTANLQQLGALCRERGIDLIIDAAQSLGVLPVYPEEWSIAACVSAGWKWLTGPFGSGVFYTAPEFRAKLHVTQASAEIMEQRFNYADRSWAPYADARRFENGGQAVAQALALSRVTGEVILPAGIESIAHRSLSLQDAFIRNLDQTKYSVYALAGAERGAILGLAPKRDAAEIVRAAGSHRLIISRQGGWLRIAPHFLIAEAEVVRAAEIMNLVG